MAYRTRSSASVLSCKVGGMSCALPLEHVQETMRPLPIEPVAGLPSFILGLAIIRGAPTPVVHAGRLIGGHDTPPGRLITVRTGAGAVALAVDDVVGVTALPIASLHEMPPLVRDAAADTIAAVGVIDASLLVILQTARLVPDDAWPIINREQPA